MSQTQLTKSFLEYTREDLRTNLDPNKVHHLKVTSAEQDYWDDECERPRMNIQTEVVSGDRAGRFGPRHSFSIGEASGTTSNGREWSRTGQEAANTLNLQIRMAVHDGKELVLSDPTMADAKMLAEIAMQIVGDEFLARTKVDKNGYDRITAFYSIINPPAGVTTPADATVGDFSL